MSSEKEQAPGQATEQTDGLLSDNRPDAAARDKARGDARDGDVAARAWLLPDHRDLYMLVGGLVLGLLLGPAVLGRAAPEVYMKWFADRDAAVTAVTAHDMKVNQTLQRLAQGDRQGVALEDFMATQDAARGPLLAKVRQADAARGRVIGAMLAVVLLMILETLPAAEAVVMRSRIATVRYAVCAVVLALVLAQPSWLVGVSGGFVVAMLLVGAAVMVLPLGGSSHKARSTGRRK